MDENQSRVTLLYTQESYLKYLKYLQYQSNHQFYSSWKYFLNQVEKQIPYSIFRYIFSINKSQITYGIHLYLLKAGGLYIYLVGKSKRFLILKIHLACKIINNYIQSQCQLIDLRQSFFIFNYKWYFN
ncbi:transmembrane protein, putative (macronuclear) [Tetrahymena thermophila SB210]|uniref:Transmembrane protein, putative n=1 Tax=Tetrahymena thermophila (strain SB210) TaxID=312017 RepID=W7X7E9_TETTS|nr:transmembrane protein, putative [Tetrahymena thermophila SB210]EWS73287.1 transmembrane protein, putative [Tetrahymena thermophila SB210]|eukprot:XP_012654196.1 transmembrane protein, putative [Tetrahymena thermophila SB210]